MTLHPLVRDAVRFKDEIEASRAAGDRPYEWRETGEWRLITKPRRCSRRCCTAPAVAKLNRGQFRDGERIASWWAYCERHLADYGRIVEHGRVWFFGPRREAE